MRTCSAWPRPLFRTAGVKHSKTLRRRDLACQSFCFDLLSSQQTKDCLHLCCGHIVQALPVAGRAGSLLKERFNRVKAWLSPEQGEIRGELSRSDAPSHVLMNERGCELSGLQAVVWICSFALLLGKMKPCTDPVSQRLRIPNLQHALGPASAQEPARGEASA